MHVSCLVLCPAAPEAQRLRARGFWRARCPRVRGLDSMFGGRLPEEGCLQCGSTTREGCSAPVPSFVAIPPCFRQLGEGSQEAEAPRWRKSSIRFLGHGIGRCKLRRRRQGLRGGAGWVGRWQGLGWKETGSGTRCGGPVVGCGGEMGEDAEGG